MDSLTQLVLGASMGELTLGRKLGWKGLAWGAFFGTLPDLDILLFPYLDAVDRLYWHRGISHSIFVTILASVFFGYALHWLHRKRGVSIKLAVCFVFLAWSTHVLIDCFTTYGTQIYEPFSSDRAALNNMAIIDPLFTLPLLLGCLVVLFMRSDLMRRFRFMLGCVACSLVYVVFSFIMQFAATHALTKYVVAKYPDAQRVATAPTLFNTLLWRGLFEREESYVVSYWSLLDKEPAQILEIPKQRQYSEALTGSRELDGLKWFSRGYWIARQLEDGGVEVADLRFTEVFIESEDQLVMEPIFRWQLYQGENGVQLKQEARSGGDLKGYLRSLGLRILGDTRQWRVDSAY